MHEWVNGLGEWIEWVEVDGQMACSYVNWRQCPWRENAAIQDCIECADICTYNSFRKRQVRK